MSAFNPTAPARLAVESGLVDAGLSDDVHNKIVHRVEIEPGVCQAVFGGIGAGKSTQLILAQRQLQSRGVTALYAEASSFTDIEAAVPGTLVAIFGLLLLGNMPEGIPSADYRAIREFAEGSWEPVIHDEDFGDGLEFVRGKLKQRVPSVLRQLEPIRKSFEIVLNSLRASSDIVFLCDGLDRIRTSEVFWDLVAPDLVFLKSLGVAVVLVVPWALVFETPERLTDTFDRVHEVSTLSNTFQTKVTIAKIIASRDKDGLLDQESIKQISKFSGGILRDIVTLARDAGEAAYMRGCDQIGREHAEEAAGNVGASYKTGLTGDQIARVKRIGTGTTEFTPTDAADRHLLLTRRVLQTAPTEYRAHPSLLRVLE